MPPTNEVLKSVEIQFLQIVADLLKKGKITRQYAKDAAQSFLTLLPFSSMDEMHDKIKTYTEKYEYLTPLHSYVVEQMDKAQTHTVLEKMRNLIKNNKIDEAVNLMES